MIVAVAENRFESDPSERCPEQATGPGGASAMNLQDNDFDLFGLPLRFAQAGATLDARWKALQAQVHPDRFAAQGDAAKRLAMQCSVRVNEAYQRLRDPLKRAAYLCALRGAPVQAEKNTAMPADFLLRQMQWRERLDEASAHSELAGLVAQVKTERDAILQECERQLDIENNPAAAAQQVRSVMFLERFLQEAGERMVALNP